MFKITIIDGYIDEPTCLGVPPYISPYPRYIAGCILKQDKKNQINYYTIDQIRQINNLSFLTKNNLIIVIAGTSVPGKYLSGYPISPNEIKKILENIPVKKILVGPAAKYGFGMQGGQKTYSPDSLKDLFNLFITGDPEIVIKKYLENNLKTKDINISDKRKNAHVIKEYANLGSKIVKQHPFYPNYVIAEIETYRGCPRTITGGCSFCSESSKGLPDFRPIDDITEEIHNLYIQGIRHFRLGNQPCIFSYQSIDTGKLEFPIPNPKAIKELFSKIRKVAPELKTLHIDNANPGVIARYPKEAKQITKIIVKYHTPGNVAAMGIESADPIVIKYNNLKATPEESLKAIKLINDIGSKRGNNGMPELLPGLNFVFGLKGETKKTFTLNYEFLKQIIDKNLLLRRINLRQIIPIPNTNMYKIGNKLVNKNKKLFKKFKRLVKENIEKPMLEKILPKATILKNVYTEKHDGKLTFARQLGSYPLLIGLPGIFNLKQFMDVKIVDYGYRSITAIPNPIDINIVQRETIEAIPGIGKKRAIRILANRPFKTKKDLLNIFDDPNVAKEVLDFLSSNN
jgi:radical SAM superfamily enzyme with C-terminal helix-hairpin-helix motif